jgi:hypothetical protein
MLFDKVKWRAIHLLAVLLVFLAYTSAFTQETGSCDVVTESAYTTAVAACPNLEPNQACYGNPLVEAELSDSALTFETPADVVDARVIESLSLSPEDSAAGAGGIVFLHLSDEDAGAEVYAVLYGNITLVPDGEGGFVVETQETPEDCTPIDSGLLIYTSGDDPGRLVLGIADAPPSEAEMFYEIELGIPAELLDWTASLSDSATGDSRTFSPRANATLLTAAS